MKASLNRGAVFSALMTIELHVVGDDDGEHPAEVAPGSLEAADDLFCRLGKRRPDELCRLNTAVKISAWQTRRRSPSGTRPRRPKSTWQLSYPAAGRRPGPSTCAARPRSARHRSGPRSGAGRPHLGGPAGCRSSSTVRSSFQPALDSLLFAQQDPPGLAVAIGPVRADPLDTWPINSSLELLLAAGAHNAQLDGRRDVAPGRLSVDADPWAMGRSPSPRNQRRSASLTWTTDTSRNAMGPPPPAALEAQPNVFSAGVGGPSRWSHNWQRGGPMSLAKPAINWSHVTGKRQRRAWSASG